jgi:protein-tyrosine phosphatase
MSARRRNPVISKIEPGLYLGGFKSCFDDYTCITKNNVSAIVTLLEDRWEPWTDLELVPNGCHMFIPCEDSPTQDILIRLAEICDFIDENRQDGSANNVLVHCWAGVSRSATVVVAYLMRKNCQSLDSALASVRECRRIEPNPNFMEQLAVWAEVKYELWIDPAKTVPKSPYAAYLARRAERLKSDSEGVNN